MGAVLIVCGVAVALFANYVIGLALLIAGCAIAIAGH